MNIKHPKYRRPLIKALSLSSMISLLAVSSCQTQAPGLQPTVSPPIAKANTRVTPLNQGKITVTPTGSGQARLTVHMQFENASAFKTQAVDCANQIADLRVKVVGLGIGELLPQGADTQGYLGDYTAGECNFSATFDNVPVGNARIISVEAYDNNQNKLTAYSLSGLIDVVASPDPQNPTVSEAEISFRSTAAGMLVKSLVKDHGLTGEALFSGMTAAAVQGFVDQLIFGSVYNSTNHGSFPAYTYATHPLLLNYEALAQYLVDVNGNLSDVPTPLSTYTLQASRLSITGLDDASPQIIRVSDPASQTFTQPSPAPGDTSQLMTGVLPGTWNVSVSNGSNGFNGVLSFAPNIDTQIVIGSTPAAASWELMAEQPETANINAFQRDPVLNSDTHILGTTKGVYLFSELNNKWSHRGLNSYNVLSVESGFDTNSPREFFFAGTEGKGIFKTTDGGASWIPAVNGNGFDNLSIYDMHARANFTLTSQLDFLFAATNDGVVEYRLASEPNPWSKVNTVLNGSSLAGSTVTSILETDPTGSSHLIITVPVGPNAGVYASLNASPGNGWYKIDGTNPAIAASQPYRLSLDPQSPETLFVMGKNGAIFSLSSSAVDIALNTTTPDVSGLSWVTQSAFEAGYGNHLLPYASQIYAATTEGVKQNSKPPASIWTDVLSSNPLPNNEVTHLENLSGTDLFNTIAFTRGGIAKYGSVAWETFFSSGPESNAGLRGADITALHADETTSTLMYVGTRHAGVFKYDGETGFYTRLRGLPDGASKEILDMAQDGTGNLVVLTPTGLYILDNPASGGGGWTEVDNLPSGFNASHLAITPIAVSSSHSIIYISSAEESVPTGVYRFNCNNTLDCYSSAATATWTQSYTLPVHSLFGLGNVSVYAGAKDIGGNYQVIKTIDGGSTWDGLNGVTPLNASSPIDLLYSSGSRVIAISTAEGPAGIRGLSTLPAETAWINVGNNLFINGGEKISSLTLADNTVYLGLSRGGVRRLDLSATPSPQWSSAQWFDFSQPLSNQTPAQNTLNLLHGFPAGNSPTSLWAATAEYGIYRTNL
jgi:hypothetical protein